jgi:hypothetical protein
MNGDRVSNCYRSYTISKIKSKGTSLTILGTCVYPLDFLGIKIGRRLIANGGLAEEEGKSMEFEKISNAYHNILRMVETRDNMALS